MAVVGFTTNNLVKEHDMYIDFLKKRRDYIEENYDDISDKNAVIPEGFKYFGEPWNKHQAERVSIIKWHSIILTYDIWCEHVKDYTVPSAVAYKRHVSVPLGVLRSFKARVEEALKKAGPNYNTYIHRHTAPFDACRYLAIFWTYLDIVKDTKTQRFLPDKVTREGAAKVFGYQEGENPFEMNGKYYHTDKEKPMEETKTTKYNLNLDASIDELNFTTRTRNGLWRAGYRKLGDIVNLKYENLIKIRNLGLVSTKEVLEKLNEIRQQSEAKEESVIDIAEQAAKEVEEERLSDTEMAQKYNKALDDIHELGVKIDSITSENEAIKKKAIKISDEYDVLLKQKLELETCVSRLRDDISILKEENQALTSQSSKLRIASDPKNLDTFALLNTVLEKMRDSKMEYILMTIDGMSIDIHPAQKVPLRSAYQIRSSEVR